MPFSTLILLLCCQPLLLKLPHPLTWQLCPSPTPFLSLMHHCCPRQTSHLQYCSLTVSLLLSLDETGGVLVAAGILNKTITEVLNILAPGLISVASIALPATKTDTATGREIGSETGEPIPATSYATPSATLLLSAPNFSNVAMNNNIVPI